MKKGLVVCLIFILIIAIGLFYLYYLGNNKLSGNELTTIENELNAELNANTKEVIYEKLNTEESINEIDINDTSDFVIANLEIGSTREMAKKIYGEPEYIEKNTNWDDDYKWFYEGLELNYYKDYLDEIVVKSDKYPTTRGIKVGDLRSEVLEKYKSARLIQEHVHYFKEIEGAVDHEGPRAVEFRLIFECRPDENGNYVVKEITSMTESF
jgi:hypothetical protein